MREPGFASIGGAILTMVAMDRIRQQQERDDLAEATALLNASRDRHALARLNLAAAQLLVARRMAAR